MTQTDSTARLKRYLGIKFFATSLIGGTFAAVLVNLLLYFLLRETQFFSGENCRSTERIFYCYTSPNSTWTDSTYLQTVSGFYTAIITLLIAVLAVVAALGAYTVRVGSKFQIEQELPTRVEDYFDRDTGKKVLQNASRLEISEQMRSPPFPSDGEFLSAFLSLERKVEKLELQLQEMQEMQEE